MNEDIFGACPSEVELRIDRRAQQQIVPVERLESGVVGLDKVLGGGLPKSHVYLVLGLPGTGKTTLAMQFLLDGRNRGESVLYITLSESARDLRSAAQSHGWSLEGVSIYEHSPAAAISSGTYHTLFHPDEVDLSETMENLMVQIDRLKPSRVIVDSLSDLRLVAGDSLRFRRQIVALRDAFIADGRTAILLDDTAFDDNQVQLQSIVHGVIQLSAFAPEYGTDHRRLRVIKLRGVSYVGGYHEYCIVTGGMQVYPRLVAADHRLPFAAGVVSSGLPGLDALFGGGIDRGTTTMLWGPSGVGKSTIAARFAVSAAQRGDRTALYLFDERLPSLMTRAKALGMDLQPYCESGTITIQTVDPAELTPSEFAAMVRRQADCGCKMIVIDSLAGFFNAMPESRSLLLQLHELLTYLGQQGVVTLVTVAQHGLVTPQYSRDVDVSYLADNVLLFRYFEHAGQIGLALSVFKRRAGKHERSIRELFIGGPNGIEIGPPLERFQGIMSGAATYDNGSANAQVLGR